MWISCLAIVLFVALGSVFHPCAGSLPRSNTTRLTLKDEDLAPDLNFAEFKERYRRLIPYMNYYLHSNNVENQSLRQENYAKMVDRPLRRPNYFRPNIDLRQDTRYQANIKNEEKFIPSVQYNPEELGPDNEYFTPVRYGMKLNQKNFPQYATQQATRPVYSRQEAETVIPDSRFFVTERPYRFHNSPEGDYVPHKEVVKTAPPKIQDDYLLDYEDLLSGKLPTPATDYNQSREEFESFRYITPNPGRIEYVRVSKPSISRPIAVNNPALQIPASQLHHIVKSLQLTNRLPEMLNKDNLDSSIRTLVEILNILHNAKNQKLHQVRLPKPVKLGQYYDLNEEFVRPDIVQTNYHVMPNSIDRPEGFVKIKPMRPINRVIPYTKTVKVKPVLTYSGNNLKTEKVIDYYVPKVQDVDTGNKETFQQVVTPQSIYNSGEHPYKVNLDSDDILEDERLTLPISTEKPTHNYHAPDGVSTHSQNIPPSLKYGATRGKPHVDYPAYSSIPPTDFSCKEQRYKGFFGDPAARCQVWHYCDLNGGKSSFLCPNGTIFNQVALTCDWWFNVKCESTTQLYVLNERLYKYILPIMPKFPEDFTGPEVDRYLELKFKEMEEKLEEKKLKKLQEEKEKAKKENNKIETPDENASE
ncbi:uncharacterized protein LOC117171778 [Belonocnema kinseyi]|uniref:uncharacterized protein LOC117171778 n=1 Tax=Belonocnema kinseyi TaxID=2817044 RepID=UPI00143D1A7D|nr:uncharacterized protein LOC117171778 [Belonocnema kinseyi]